MSLHLVPPPPCPACDAIRFWRAFIPWEERALELWEGDDFDPEFEDPPGADEHGTKRPDGPDWAEHLVQDGAPLTAGLRTAVADFRCAQHGDPVVEEARRLPEWYGPDLSYYLASRDEWQKPGSRVLAMTVGGSVTHRPDCNVIQNNIRCTDEVIDYLEGVGDFPKGNVPYPRWVDGDTPTCRHCLGWTGR